MKFVSLLAFAFVISNNEAIMPELPTIPSKVVLSGKQKRKLKRKVK
jgi:hypothetical protein